MVKGSDEYLGLSMTSRQNPNPHVPQLSGWRTRVAVVWVMVVHATTGWATHNRAGEITYTHVQGLTYEVVITTYTKSDALADRPFLFLRWGDETGNDLDSLARDCLLYTSPSPRD